MLNEFSGLLSHRVAIEGWVDARDDAGADAGHWQASGNAWAAVLPDGAGLAAGQARRSHRRWRVILRRGLVVGLTSRLIWQGQLLAVLAVEDDPRVADRIVLRCEARVV